jgi:hypothetical protein
VTEYYDVLIKKKNIRVTILLASIDLLEPGRTWVDSVALRASDSHCTEEGRLDICSFSHSSEGWTADHHDPSWGCIAIVPITLFLRDYPFVVRFRF